MKRWACASVVVLGVVGSGALSSLAADDARDGRRWWSHVAVLADDALEGRGTGSPGHRKAAEYVAGQFAKLGLRPAGSDGFLQPVPLKSRVIDEAHSQLVLVRAGGEQALALGDDVMISLRVDPAASFEAPLVFAGYGISIPEYGHDDFRGLDAHGKVVVYLRGAPADVPGPLAAHAQSEGERAQALRRAGAIGAVMIHDTKQRDIPWERATLARLLPTMALADSALDENAGLQISLSFNPAHANTLLAGSGHTYQEILDAAQAGRPLPHFAIPATLRGNVAVTRTDVSSPNVVALRPGSDPAVADEFVVISAHLDHLGIGPPIGGDTIYNGAMDNAAGVAALLDIAAILQESAADLRRPVLFVVVTGEETGLLGSRYFAHHPTVTGQIVADLNTDMFLPLFPLERLTVYGLDESDLGADAVSVAEALGIAVEPDPEPARNIFIRSDQYSFIRQGVPALMFKVAFSQGSPQEATFRRWLKERYHAPSDDLNQPVDRAAAESFDRYQARLLERIANRAARPHWKETSFFKRYEH